MSKKKTAPKKVAAKRSANGKPKLMTPVALLKSDHGTKKFRDVLAKLGARRKDGAPMPVDVIYATTIAGMPDEESLATWALVYPHAQPGKMRHYRRGGTFAGTLKRLTEFVAAPKKEKTAKK